MDLIVQWRIVHYPSTVGGEALKFIADIVPPYVKPHMRTILKWSLIGYLIRITIIPIGWHGDVLVNGWISYVLREYNQLVASNNSPLLYYLFTAFYSLLGPIIPQAVFSDVTLRMGFTPVHLSTVFRESQTGIWAFLFLTMMPYLIFDFAIALTLLHLFKNEKNALLAFTLWMMNPVAIHTSYYVGTYHIIVTFFFILALYFLRKKKVGWAMLSLGLSSALSPFFLLFVPIIACIYSKEKSGVIAKARGIFLMFTIAVLPFAANFFASHVTPVYYESVNAATPRDFNFNGFFGRTQYYRGQPTKYTFLSGLFFFFLDYSASLKTLEAFPDVIYFLPLVYSIFLLGTIYYDVWSFQKVWKAILVFLLAFYSLSLFHSWWFLWVQPLLILLVAKNRDRFQKLYLALIVLFFIYIGYWNDVFIGIMENLGLPALQVLNLFRSVMSGIMILTAYFVLRDIVGGAET